MSLITVDGASLVAPTAQNLASGYQFGRSIANDKEDRARRNREEARLEQELNYKKQQEMAAQQEKAKQLEFARASMGLGSPSTDQAAQPQMMGQQKPLNPTLGAPVNGTQIPMSPNVQPQQPQMDEEKQEAAFKELLARDPEAAMKIQKSLGINTDAQKQQAGEFAFSAYNMPFDQRQPLIMERVNKLESQGRDATQTRELLNMDDNQQRQALKITELATLPTKDRVSATAPEKPTGLEADLIQMGYTPGTPEYQEAARQIKMKPLVNIADKTESIEQQGIAKIDVKRLDNVVNEAQNSQDVLETVNQIKALNPETGATEGIKANIAAFADSFGLTTLAKNIGDPKKKQSLDAIVNTMTNAILNKAKGPQTDADAERARSTIANIKNTPAAFKFKNDYLDNISKRSIEQAEFIRNEIDSGKNINRAFKDWREFKNKTPLISSKLRNADDLPVYFYQFERDAKQKRPGITRGEILEAWREINNVR